MAVKPEREKSKDDDSINNGASTNCVDEVECQLFCLLKTKRRWVPTTYQSRYDMQVTAALQWHSSLYEGQKVKGHQAALVGCSNNYIIYMDDTIFYATDDQSEPLPVDHEYSWRKACWAPQA